MADYYQIHFQEYFKKTISLDPSGFLDPLLNRLKKGGSILDVGCGSGRDLV
ncbi:MAG: hypothetical protein HN580_05140 [Deltaproteobacteria bacterium]|jgi:hypothetical protein|nr:hypothetical protein [Deltaproteobacteria bacterium]MBT4639468.1 hypothetical protein [Deltaproteobacteria bacterium]MBT6499276.1 hypothetical protein [Deltaproteobacteria bacterium]MBT7154854.1 hypothetical protein [Deltaproteobacteria bacterium]MBT7715700.1 hypothetical protein [Deltaproteobacteria bacterium]